MFNFVFAKMTRKSFPQTAAAVAAASSLEGEVAAAGGSHLPLFKRLAKMTEFDSISTSTQLF